MGAQLQHVIYAITDPCHIALNSKLVYPIYVGEWGPYVSCLIKWFSNVHIATSAHHPFISPASWWQYTAALRDHGDCLHTHHVMTTSKPANISHPVRAHVGNWLLQLPCPLLDYCGYDRCRYPTQLSGTPVISEHTVKSLIWDAPNLKNWMLLVSSCSCFYPIRWTHVLSWEWRCSWSSADRRCSNYIWVINKLIAY